MALIEKSRRARSWCRVAPVPTEGNAPGDAYVSCRALARSKVWPSGACQVAVPNGRCTRKAPPKVASRSRDRVVASPSTTRSKSSGEKPRSRSRTNPPTRATRIPNADARRQMAFRPVRRASSRGASHSSPESAIDIGGIIARQRTDPRLEDAATSAPLSSRS